MKKPKSISIADYLAGEEVSDVKREYLGGVVHTMAGNNNRHNMIATSLLSALALQLRGKTWQVFNSNTKIRIQFSNHTRFYYPDAMVICHPNPETDHYQDQPVVVIEVLSESTRRTDLGEKRDAYMTMPSLKVLLFIEPECPSVTVYRRKPEGGFAAELHSGLESTIPLPEIDAALPLAELYERVTFNG